MPSLASIQFIDEYWSSFLGCRIDDIYTNQALVVPHAGLGDYPGTLLFRRGPSCIISVPAAMLDSVAGALGDREPHEIFNSQFLEQLFGSAINRIVGPAYLGYVDATDFHPVSEEEVDDTRLLGEADEIHLRKLEAACGEADWEHSSIQIGRSPIFGCFVSGRLIAAGSLERVGVRLLNVGVVTHPAYRGRGCGRAVVSAMTQYGLDQGSILQYRTLQGNAASQAIARALGYHEYAATLAVRLNHLESVATA